MKNDSLPDDDLGQAIQVDRASFRFEQAMRSGEAPVIEDFLRNHPDTIRTGLLENLLLLECDYRLEQGEQLPIDDYRRRFPKDAELVNKAISAYQDRHSEQASALGDIDHYTPIRKLGQGGMGEVWLANDTKLERRVALKLLPTDLAGDHDRRQRFLAEAKAASALNHPNVCVIHEVGETTNQRPYIVMEYLDGQTLDEFVRGGRGDMAVVLNVAIQIADALAAAHSHRIVHRDIKPSNITVNVRGQVKVLDFGLAKRLSDATQSNDSATVDLQTQSGTVLGTPRYMNPEQALGKPIDHRSDIFSFGVVLYELVTGRLPFEGESFGEIVDNILHEQPAAMARFNYDLPQAVESIILKCLQKDADRRYQSADELLVDLKNHFESTGVLAGKSIHVHTAQKSGFFGSHLGDLPDSDIFINCAQLDDQPVVPGKEGWITRLQRNLRVRLEQLSGEPVKISAFPSPPGDAGIHDTVLEHLPKVKTLVSVVSPPFTKSKACQEGVLEFCEKTKQSGQFLVQDRPRLFKVVKAPVEDDELPRELSSLFRELMAFEFFDRDKESGRFREFDEAFGEDAQQRYYEKVYDLAYEIAQVLKAQPADGGNNIRASDGLRIYLAETTSEIQSERDRLRRELIEQGHQVLPERALPLVGSEIQRLVRECLEQADLSIHLLGERYGLVPEDSEDSLVVMQNAIAAGRSAQAGLSRLIWMPRGIVANDDRQRTFLEQVRNDPQVHCGAEIIEDTLENLKEIIEHKRALMSKADDVAASMTSSKASRVYLICDQRDEANIEAMEDYFFEQGVEVSIPDFDSAVGVVSEIHWQHLRDCDAAVIYYGAASKSWVDIKLRELLKAIGYRDGLPIQHQLVYVAPPFDRRKERFKTHSAHVIRQTCETFDGQVLSPFVQGIFEAKQAAS